MISWIRKKIQCMKAEHPCPTAWNWVFMKPKDYWVKAHLKNGSVIGGLYGGDSFVSSYPKPEQIYLEKVCIMDDNHDFVEVREDSDGIIIFKDELVSLELFKPISK